MRTALDVHRELLARDVPHEIVRLRGGPVLGADDLPRVLGVEPTSCVAVRCYVTDLGTAAVLVHAGVVPDPAAVLDALGASTLRAATADEVNAATDYAAGLVCPIGLPVEVPVVLDAALQSQDVLYCPVGEGGVALGIRSAALLAALPEAVSTSLTGKPMRRDERGVWGDGARVIDLDRPGRRRSPRRSTG